GVGVVPGFLADTAEQRVPLVAGEHVVEVGRAQVGVAHAGRGDRCAVDPTGLGQRVQPGGLRHRVGGVVDLRLDVHGGGDVHTPRVGAPVVGQVVGAQSGVLRIGQPRVAEPLQVPQVQVGVHNAARNP